MTPDRSPQIILHNGLLATASPVQDQAQAVAVENHNILAVGPDREILNLAGLQTQKIDLNGRLVVPGFIDTHIHFYEWALNRQRLNLAGLSDIEALLDRVRSAAENQSAGQWIIGQGWNETDWTERCMPTRDKLDQVAPDHPVLLWRCDLHLAAANTRALQQADISAHTPDPPEGRIERDATGQPTGILRELAINLVRKAIAPPDPEHLLQAFEAASHALHRRGVTGIHDVRLMADQDGASAWQTFQKLDREKRLDLRCWVTLPGDQLDHIIKLGFRSGFGNNHLRIGHVKFFADGGMGARTAWVIDPYLDAERGMPLVDMQTLAHDISRAHQAGLAVMVHAVGDRANRELINIFEALESLDSGQQLAVPAFPHRIEHVQMIRPEDARRLRELHLALCVTPANMLLDMNLIDLALGDRGKWTYAFRQLLDTGAPVMFSSDCPVCDPDPLLGIHAAVTRQRPDGTPEGGWHPKSCVTVGEALDAYTSTPATVHKADDLGVLAPGKKADLTVLSDDILTLPPGLLPEVQVDMTLFGGRIVHRRF